jgi:hypothetical protein
VVLLSATSGGNANNPVTNSVRTSTAPTTTTRKRHKPRTATVDPGNVTVAVLNGTATNRLATDVSQRLAAVGFKHSATNSSLTAGYIGNASTQTHATTLVEYLPGNSNRLAALAVASKLGLSSNTVQAIDSSSQTIACAQPTPCPPTGVVVTVGSDLDGSATTSTGGATTASGTSGVSTSTGAVGAGTSTTP